MTTYDMVLESDVCVTLSSRPMHVNVVDDKDKQKIVSHSAGHSFSSRIDLRSGSDDLNPYC
jgi:hypothetical protein